MKKFILACAALLTSFGLWANNFEEGVHYKVISEQATSEPEVMEYFSFNCIHCYSFAPVMNNLKAELDGEVAVRATHVDFLGNNGRDLTWAYAMMVIMDVEDQVKMPLFAAIHDNRARINRNTIPEFFELHGVDPQEFANYAQSFAVSGLEARMRQATVAKQIRGTPTVIVNGRYEINRGAVPVADMVDLIRFLVAKDFS